MIDFLLEKRIKKKKIIARAGGLKGNIRIEICNLELHHGDAPGRTMIAHAIAEKER